MTWFGRSEEQWRASWNDDDGLEEAARAAATQRQPRSEHGAVGGRRRNEDGDLDGDFDGGIRDPFPPSQRQLFGVGGADGPATTPQRVPIGSRHRRMPEENENPGGVVPSQKRRQGEASTRNETDSIREKRRKLLALDDWTGAKVRKPLAVRFERFDDHAPVWGWAGTQDGTASGVLDSGVQDTGRTQQQLSTPSAPHRRDGSESGSSIRGIRGPQEHDARRDLSPGNIPSSSSSRYYRPQSGFRPVHAVQPVLGLQRTPSGRRRGPFSTSSLLTTPPPWLRPVPRSTASLRSSTATSIHRVQRDASQTSPYLGDESRAVLRNPNPENGRHAARERECAHRDGQRRLSSTGRQSIVSYDSQCVKTPARPAVLRVTSSPRSTDPSSHMVSEALSEEEERRFQTDGLAILSPSTSAVSVPATPAPRRRAAWKDTGVETRRLPRKNHDAATAYRRLPTTCAEAAQGVPSQLLRVRSSATLDVSDGGASMEDVKATARNALQKPRGHRRNSEIVFDETTGDFMDEGEEEDDGLFAAKRLHIRSIPDYDDDSIEDDESVSESCNLNRGSILLRRQ
ncbi:hypothetical protein SPI_06280 [Niveomyces insectorum RCEF 264]|uniref:Uncharacterized protein n=1 Tax=Niveomyces insectorum RCEF 264 TaxID=1081102 RepID=A0A167RZ36_9HYPO|nr:hypothetical protein SPI_06280 [Niveomyces insectorum RCEF 264]